jgi:hypothetical protein
MLSDFTSSLGSSAQTLHKYIATTHTQHTTPHNATPHNATQNDVELRLLVEGSTEREICLLDMRASTLYAPPLHAAHPTITMLWNVLATLTQEQARAFLKFCFGGAGVPIQG